MVGSLISVVVTTLNEAKHLRDLLESLAMQEPPFEVLIVDAGSADGTVEIAKRFGAEFPNFHVLHRPGSRGESRNHAVERAQGEYVAFIDGDCIANAFWLRTLRKHLGPRRVLAGRSMQIGYWAFERLERVELIRRGYDITHPSSNLVYPRPEFLRLQGFDPRFVTAEDIDLNFRAVEDGLEIQYLHDAVVYHRARDSIRGFLKQAFWNGYGRKQLTLKHGRLWSEYSFRRMLTRQFGLWGFLRLASAVLGYFRCKIREAPGEWRKAQHPLARGVTT
ncbi:MAG: glycosyltransferase [Euryarchaeota archaeon]|nr:glycosyltransferase [Euryarchaeota archaeon]